MRQIAIQAAEAGGKLLLQKFGTRLRIEHKGEVDLVTEADRAAEEVIVQFIQKTFPLHDFLAEERDYGQRDSRFRWIIDPLDGTTNYAHGFPWFAVSIALEVDGQVELGVVHHPLTGEMFWAERGAGAFVNDSPLRISSVDRLDQALLATGFPYDRKTSPCNNYDHFINLQQAAQACRRPGVASLDLAYTAAGRFDGYWEMKLKPWDVAAGQLLVREAGGMVSNFDGQPLDIYGLEVVASNGKIHDEMLTILQGGVRPGS